MLLKKNVDDKINTKKVNEVLTLWAKILKIAYFLIFILGIYAITLIVQAWNLFPIITTILILLTPLFIGIVFAWLLDPMASYLAKRGIKRNWGTLVILICFISVVALILAAFIPLMKDQIDQFVAILPNLMDTLTDWSNSFFAGLDAKNATAIQDSFANSLQTIVDKLSNNLPNATIDFVTSFFAGLGTFLIGLVIGFYLLLNFDHVHTNIVAFLPKRYREVYGNIAGEMNTSLRNFVSGILLSSFFVFLVATLGFYIVGLKSPVLFGLICGITNLIPYIGPYIGGFPAAVVGFTISPMTGVFTILIIFMIHTLESLILSPVIMSKAVKLHPVTIIVGLVIFGSLFGIVGMILATPIIAVAKIIFTFLIEKYNFFNWNEIA